MKSFVRRFALVFGLWTLVSVCAAIADYLILHSLGRSLPFWAVFRRPLTESWIWAGLTPVAFLVAHHFPLSRPRLIRAICVHVACFFALSWLHCLIAQLVGGPMAAQPRSYTGSLLQLRFLEEFYSDIWMYWPLVCIQALIDSHARAREREKRAAELEGLLTTSHLALLRAQIQPHFLFNTLHALSALIRFDARSAEDMVADLAEILRASFADPMSQETRLRCELELVACYLRIQQRRFGDRLAVSFVVAPELLEAAVPALVLQSLVENAVIHGIAPLNRRGTLEIRAYRRDDRLVLHVEDDGAGLRETPCGGMGLSNARRRLQQLYGNQQFLEVNGERNRGVSAILSIPFRIPPRDAEAKVALRENPDTDRGRRGARAAQPVVVTRS